MKALLICVMISLASCTTLRRVPEQMEKPAVLIRIDTTFHSGDPLWKTLTFMFLEHHDSTQYWFVDMSDTRKVGTIYHVTRPLDNVIPLMKMSNQ